MVNYEILMGLLGDLCRETLWTNNFASSGIDKDGLIQHHTLNYQGTNVVTRFKYRDGGDILSVALMVGEKKEHGGEEYGKNNHFILIKPTPEKYVIEYKTTIDQEVKHITYEAEYGKFLRYEDFDGNYWDASMGMDFHFPKPVENVADLIRRIVYENSEK